jgi:hypothetical protein
MAGTGAGPPRIRQNPPFRQLVVSTDPDRAEGPVGSEGLDLGIDEGVLIRLDEPRGEG